MGVCTNILNILSDNAFEETVKTHQMLISKERIKEDRIKHMHMVAEVMYEYYDVFKCKYLSREEIYVLGLNHDIGYMQDKGKIDHELYGGYLFASFCEEGQQHMMAKCIFHHGDTPKQYMEQYMCTEDEIPKELILLWMADLSVESNGEHAGEIVGFEKRLESLKERYGEKSKAYQISKETADWLINYFAKEYLLTT